MRNQSKTTVRRNHQGTASKAAGYRHSTLFPRGGDRKPLASASNHSNYVIAALLLIVCSYFVLHPVYRTIIDFKHHIHTETGKHLESVYNFSSNLRRHKEQFQHTLAKMSKDIETAARHRSHALGNISSAVLGKSANEDEDADSPEKPGPAAPSVLVSSGATVTSSVRGNLGPASVVVNGKTGDWLKDRWQAAKDMSGTPIKGEHFLLLEFERPVTELEKITLDWETAMATKFVVEIANGNAWATLYSNDGFLGKVTHHLSPHFKCTAARRPTAPKQHIIDDITCTKVVPGDTTEQINKLRVKMVPATKWGVSLWEVDVRGKFYQLE